MVNLTPSELDAGTASDSSVVHSSQDDVTTDSKKHTERDISRLQGTTPDYNNSKTYNLNDLVTFDEIIYRNTIAIGTPETFDVTKWTTITRLPDAYVFVDNSTQQTAALPDDSNGKITSALFKQEFDVSAQIGDPTDIFFKPDGLKMFVVGSLSPTNRVYTYVLSTPNDISTAVFDNSQSFTLTSFVLPDGLAFKPDGTIMYVIFSTPDDILEFALSTPWDPSTASLTNTFNVTSEETFPTSVYFKPDGTRMFIIGGTGLIQQYNLSIPWDISSAVFSTITFDLTSFGAAFSLPEGLYFSEDGRKIYVVPLTTGTPLLILLGAPWDISILPADVVSETIDISEQSTTLTGIFLNAGLSKMYLSSSGVSIQDILEFDVGIKTEGSFIGLPTVPEFSTSKSYVLGNIVTFDEILYRNTIAIGTPETFDVTKWTRITTLPDAYVFVDNSTQQTAALPDDTNGKITSALFKQQLDVFAQDNDPHDVFFKPDGFKMFIVGDQNNTIFTYDLSVAEDISTAVNNASESFVLPVAITLPRGIFFKPDGFKMFVTDLTTDSVYEFTLSTAWDPSTASQTNAFDTTTEDSIPVSISFKGDGTRMFVQGNQNDTLYQYNLSVPWSLASSSVSFSGITFDTSFLDSAMTGIHFSQDGKKIYFIGVADDNVDLIPLGIPWDITSFTGTSEFFQTFIGGPGGIFLNAGLSKIYVINNVGEDVLEFDVGIKTDGVIFAASTSHQSVATATNLTTAGESIIEVSDPTGGITITLSSTDIELPGVERTILDTSGNANFTDSITIATQGAQTINGSSTITITEPFGQRTLYSDGSNLFVVGESVTASFAWPLIDETTAPTVAVHYTTEPSPYNMIIDEAIAGLTTAGGGAALFTLDVLKETGENTDTFATIFSTAITIDAAEFTSTTAATQPVLSTTIWEKGRRLQLSVTVLDTDTTARGPKIELITHK